MKRCRRRETRRCFSIRFHHHVSAFFFSGTESTSSPTCGKSSPPIRSGCGLFRPGKGTLQRWCTVFCSRPGAGRLVDSGGSSPACPTRCSRRPHDVFCPDSFLGTAFVCFPVRHTFWRFRTGPAASFCWMGRSGVGTIGRVLKALFISAEERSTSSWSLWASWAVLPPGGFSAFHRAARDEPFLFLLENYRIMRKTGICSRRPMPERIWPLPCRVYDQEN